MASVFHAQEKEFEDQMVTVFQRQEDVEEFEDQMFSGFHAQEKEFEDLMATVFHAQEEV